MAIELNTVFSQVVGLNSSPVSELPDHLLGCVIPYLNQQDIQAAVSVSRKMHSVVIQANNYNEAIAIKVFVDFLIRNLDMEKFSAQRNFLIKMLGNIESQDFITLTILKEYILAVKEELIIVIQSLDDETIDHLKSQSIKLPKFMEDIFQLAAIYKKIDQSKLKPDERTRWSDLGNYSEALAQAGSVDRAIEVAMTIPSEYIRKDAFAGISKALAQAGSIDRAIEIAMTISVRVTREVTLQKISQALTEAGSLDRAIEVAMTIPTEYTRGRVLEGISRALAEAGGIDRAIEVAMTIETKETREGTLRHISKVQR